MARVILVRHGQATTNGGDYDQLSPLGLRQAARTGQALPQGVALVSGSLRRHRQTAQGALPDHAIREDADWNELDFMGILRALRPELRSMADLIAALRPEPDPNRAFQRLYSAALERWSSGAHDGDYAETRPEFRARVARALGRLEGPSIVFTSGGPIAAVLQSLLDLSEPQTRGIEAAIANCSLTRLSIRSRPRLISFNAFTHLEDPADDLVSFR